MAIRVAINGFGRIGRNFMRAMRNAKGVEVVGINDLTDPDTLAHLLQYDSVHGKFPTKVKAKTFKAPKADSQVGALIVDGKTIPVFAQKDKNKFCELPWKELGVFATLESTGILVDPANASQHLMAGAKKVVISAPAKKSKPEAMEKWGYKKESVDGTFVMGVNHHMYKKSQHHIVSNASCTTNCLAPIAKVLHDAYTIESGLMVTIHSYTNDQRILDLPHSDLRRARAAAMSMIPTSTGAAKAIGLVIPELQGKLDGYAIRVPTPDTSIVDLTVKVKNKPANAEAVNAVMAKAAQSKMLKGFLEYCDQPLVSIDFTGNSASSIFDALTTKVIDDQIKVASWYDNEWGYSSRLVDLIKYMAK